MWSYLQIKDLVEKTLQINFCSATVQLSFPAAVNMQGVSEPSWSIAMIYAMIYLQEQPSTLYCLGTLRGENYIKLSLG